MAVVTRYVNTASTPGGDGTTNNTSGSTRAYASLSEWEAAEQTDLVAAGDSHVVICSGTAADTTEFTLSGWTTGSGNGITIKTDSALTNSRHGGTFSTSAYRLEGSNIILDLFQDYVTIEGLQFYTGATDDNGHEGIDANGSDQVVVDGCIFRHNSGNQISFGSNCYGFFGGVDSAGQHFIKNSLFYDYNSGSNSAGMRTTNYSSVTAYVYHCTFDNCTDGTRDGYNDIAVKNCVFTNCAISMRDGHDGASTDNFADDATLRGSNQNTNLTITYAGANDFHSTDTDLVSTLNLYSDANLAVTLDIDEDARPSSGNVYAGIDEPATSTDVTVTPSAVAAATTTPAPTVTTQESVTVSPAALAATTTTPSVTAVTTANVTVLVSELSNTVAMPAPSVAAVQNVNLTPASLTATSATPAVTAVTTANASVSVSALSATTATPAVTVSTSGGVSVSPAALSASIVTPAPTVSAERNVSVAPGSLAATTTTPAVTVSTGGNVTVTPSALAVTTAALAVTVAAEQNVTVTPVSLSVAAAMPAVTVDTAGNVAIVAGALTATIATTSPSVSTTGSVSIEVSPVTVLSVIAAATVSANATIQHGIVEGDARARQSFSSRTRGSFTTRSR